MTELMEGITFGLDADDEFECPFDHRPKTHDKKNVLPPPSTQNNATKLSASLAAESAHVENIDIAFTCRSKAHAEEAQFTAHHLVPGNETWPKTRLYKWVDKRKGHIKGDIGYDINGRSNGVDLPGHTAAPAWSDAQYQSAYAFACMESDRKMRQFHDRHPAYSDFVVKSLNKMAEKLERPGMPPGCGKKNCGGGGASKPYDPPYDLIERLAGVALRLERHLVGSSRRWKKPLFTSRFALMYKNRKLSQDEARAELKVG